MKYTGARIVLEVIKENNIDTVFGYPGGSILPIYDELANSECAIRNIRTACESGAAHAADAYARVGGKTGVVLATSGPGATNLVTALAAAQADSTPLVAITGNTVTDMIGHDSFQEVYISGITMPITKHNFVVRQKEDLLPMLRRAFEIASEGRRGVVLVDVPKNILTAEISYTKPKKSKYKMPRASLRDIKKLASLINSSKKPLICFGGGVIASESEKELLNLCKKSQIPACHSLMGTGALDTNFKYNIGLAGMHGKASVAKALDECDLLLAIGTRFSDRIAYSGKGFASEAKRVHIDIDDAEISKSVRISLGIQADAKQVLSVLYDFVDEKERTRWISKIEDWQKILDLPFPETDTLNAKDILAVLSENADENAIIVTDVGQHQMWTAQLYPFKYPKTFVTSGGLGAMGFGMGAAIGSKVANPDKQVFLITGDASFHMDMNEFATAVRLGMDIKVIVMDNNALGMVRQWQHMLYNSRYIQTTDAHTTDFALMAKAFGGKGFYADKKDVFKKVLKDTLKTNTPSIIHCKISENDEVLPLNGENGDIVMK